MALTLVAEDGTGKTNSNSYATEAAGDSYHEGHLYATAWTGATSANKQAALVMATRLLDDNFEWNGRKADSTNALEWPRFSVKDRNNYQVGGDTIPAALVNATAEMARLLLLADRTAEPDDKGFSRLKAGSLAMEINREDRKGIVSNVVAQMLSPYGRLLAGSGVKVTRS